MSLQDFNKYHGLFKVNKHFTLEEIINDTKYFNCDESWNLYYITPFFYFDEVVLTSDKGTVVSNGKLILLDKDYDGLIDFRSVYEPKSVRLFVQSKDPFICFVYSDRLCPVRDTDLTLKFYFDNDTEQELKVVSDNYGFIHLDSVNTDYKYIEAILNE